MSLERKTVSLISSSSFLLLEPCRRGPQLTSFLEKRERSEEGPFGTKQIDIEITRRRRRRRMAHAGKEEEERRIPLLLLPHPKSFLSSSSSKEGSPCLLFIQLPISFSSSLLRMLLLLWCQRKRARKLKIPTFSSSSFASPFCNLHTVYSIGEKREEKEMEEEALSFSLYFFFLPFLFCHCPLSLLRTLRVL